MPFPFGIGFRPDVGMLLVYGLGIVIVIFAAVWLFLKKGKELVALYALAYDPARRLWEVWRLIEVTPGLYADPQGRYMALIPTDAPADTFECCKKRFRVYPVVKFGNVWGWYDFPKLVELVYGSHGLGRKFTSLAEMIVYLYRKGEIPGRLRLRPDMELGVYVSGQRMAEILSELYDRAAEEGVVSIAAMTGKRREFEAYVKTLIELKRKEAEALGGALLKYGLIFVVILAVLWAFLKALGGAHP